MLAKISDIRILNGTYLLTDYSGCAPYPQPAITQTLLGIYWDLRGVTDKQYLTRGIPGRFGRMLVKHVQLPIRELINLPEWVELDNDYPFFLFSSLLKK